MNRFVEALKMVAPFCLAVRYDNFSHCIEASVCGAAVLRKQGFKAHVIPCALVGTSSEAAISIGLTSREAYAMTATANGVPTYEDWKQVCFQPTLADEEDNIHAVIHATIGDEQLLIDMTLIQLREKCRLNVPAAIAIAGTFDSPVLGGFEMQESGWSFQYLRSQRAGRFAQLISGYSNPGFVEDLTEMGSIALACNLNLEAFVSMLRTLQPEGHAKVSERFEALRVVT